MRKRGWSLWQEIIWAKPSAPPSGTVKIRCNPSHEYILWFVRRGHRPLFNGSDIREEGKTPAGKVMPPVGGKKYGEYKKSLVSDGKRCRQDVWTMSGSRNRSSHVAPFPEEIPSLIITACSNHGDLVVDPFSGIRTTSIAAAKLGRSSLCFDIYDHVAISGIDLKLDYVDIVSLSSSSTSSTPTNDANGTVPDKVKNPETNRMIVVGKGAYNALIKKGYVLYQGELVLNSSNNVEMPPLSIELVDDDDDID